MSQRSDEDNLTLPKSHETYWNHVWGDLTIKTDPEWGGIHNTKKSTSGVIFMLTGGLVSCYGRDKQFWPYIASIKTKYIRLISTAKEASCFFMLFIESLENQSMRNSLNNLVYLSTKMGQMD